LDRKVRKRKLEQQNGVFGKDLKKHAKSVFTFAVAVDAAASRTWDKVDVSNFFFILYLFSLL